MNIQIFTEIVKHCNGWGTFQMFEYSDFHCLVFCETSLELLVGLLVGGEEEEAEINVLETCLAFSSF